jgi:hypothetical protein
MNDHTNGTCEDGPHECTDRCCSHVCRRLAPATVRKIHFCLSGALARPVRWHWISMNPLDSAEPPRGVVNKPLPRLIPATMTRGWLLWSGDRQPGRSCQLVVRLVVRNGVEHGR